MPADHNGGVEAAGDRKTTGSSAAELADLAAEAARAAGAELIRRYGHVAGLRTKSSATDPTSDADRASESLIAAMLRAARPGDGLLGEEGAAAESRTGITWVVDPLDGTVNYLYQLDNFAVSIAARDAQGSLAGVVFDPVSGRLYSATRGGGAWLHGRRLAVRDPVPLAGALLATGFGYAAERRAAQGAMIAELLPQVRDIRRIGSAALDLCALAAGSVDAYLEEGVHLWDIAAGSLIASEAGAVVTVATPSGAPSGVLAAGPALHADLAGAVQRWAVAWRAGSRH